MSDEKLRELERRWKETGSAEDEAVFLLERVRVGELTQERLELAAHCGHQGANVATGSPPWSQNAEAWVHALLAWEGVEEVAVRVAVAIARSERSVDSSSYGEFGLAVRAAIEWVICPCSEHLEGSTHAAEAARDAAEGQAFLMYTGTKVDNVLAGQVAAQCAEVPQLWVNLVNVLHTKMIMDGLSSESLADEPVPDGLLDTVQRELSPWLLEGRDPLRPVS